MIRVKKDFRKYATRVDIPADLEYCVSDIQKHLKKESIKNLKVPKNTLRVVFLKKRIGYHGDGFALDMKTIIFTCNIITFKR